MGNFESFLAQADNFLRWDGWRALAAIGTFSAVWIALRRDERSDRRAAIKDAHMIAALLDQARSVLGLASAYQKAKGNSKALRSRARFYENIGGTESMSSSLKGIKISDCPTVEVMTTVSVLIKIFDRVSKFHEEIDELSDEDLKNQNRAIEPLIISLDRCINDLECELKVVSGKFYDWAHQEGHRRKVDEKLNGTLRSRALKAAPGLLWAIITNKSTGREKLKD